MAQFGIPGAKSNPTAAAAPTATDDESLDYAIGSSWVYGGTVYICVDSTRDAAVWVVGGSSVAQSSGVLPSEIFGFRVPSGVVNYSNSQAILAQKVFGR